MEVRELYRKLRKEAECPLCLQTISEPKILPCLHSFCLGCINKLAITAKRELQKVVSCPLCFTAVQLLEGGTLDKLQTSFHLDRLVDILVIEDASLAKPCVNCEGTNSASHYCSVCEIFLCKTCFDTHQRLQITRGHRRVLIQNLKARDAEKLMHRPVMCTQKYHERKTLEYYCKECKVCVCHKCGLINHSLHTMMDITQAAENRKMQITDVLEKVKRQVIVCEDEIAKREEHFEKTKRKIVDIRNNVQTTALKLVQVINDYKTEMMSRLDDIYREQEKANAAEIKRSQLFLSQLRSSVEFAEAMLKRNIGPEILQTDGAVIARCNDLLATKKTEISHQILIDYPADAHLVKTVRRLLFGRVIFRINNDSCSTTSGLSEPETDASVISGVSETGEGPNSWLSKPEVNMTNDSKFQYGDLEKRFSDKNNNVTRQNLSKQELDITSEIVNSKTGKYLESVAPSDVVCHEGGIVTNVTPPVEGPLPLHAIPYQYKVAFRIGSAGKVEGKFDWPQDVAVNSKTGNFVVADRDNNRIQIFTSNGSFLTEFGRKGTGIQELRKPRSVAFTRSGDVIAVHSKKISIFTETGQFIKHVTSPYLIRPGTVSVGQNGHVIAYDESDHLIKVLSSDWTELQLSLNPFTSDECLCFFVYHQEKLFVSNHSADCVSVYNKHGTFLYNIGREGSRDGQLSYPAGLAIDRFNNLIVCDYGNGRLQVFTLDGEFLSKVEGRLVELGSPWSLAVSDDGHIFVTDVDKDCVHVLY